MFYSFDRFVALPVPFIRQKKNGDCLPACAAMVLRYLDVRFRYGQLPQILKTRSNFGTPFSHIENLQRLNVRVAQQRGDLDRLYTHLLNDQPVILPVTTGDLPHWEANVFHAVVLVGLDQQYAYIHDPNENEPAIRLLHGDLALARIEFDEAYAVLTRDA